MTNDETKPNVIVLAEDDADDRLLLKDAVSECHWPSDLRFVQDGQELLDYLLRRGKYSPPNDPPRPGLILLDLNMPKKDGRDALREIKSCADLRRIPVVVLTTSQAEADVEAMYGLGASSFIPKPVRFEGLVNVLRVLGQYWFQTVTLPPAK